MRPTVWLKPGILLIYGAALDAELHQHNAVQLVIPVSGTSSYLEMESERGGIKGSAIVDAQVMHKLTMDEGWVLLVEPHSDLGQRMSTLLAEKKRTRGVMSVGDNSIGRFDALDVSGQKGVDDVLSWLIPVFSQLGLEPFFTQLITGEGRTSSHDKRIQQLVCMLDEYFQEGGDFLVSWAASDVAKQLCLSEGRFLHLFRQEMLIPWRPYLLWRRMMCAMSALISGVSATEAAHLAGFSDSAHLSRTFRRLFGMSIRQALRLFE